MEYIKTTLEFFKIIYLALAPYILPIEIASYIVYRVWKRIRPQDWED